MRQFQDLTAQRFGKLTVMKLSHRDPLNKSVWVCKCDCGVEKIIRSDALKRNGTKSCGCSRRGKTSPLWKGVGEIHRYVLTRIKEDAKIRNIEFNVTLEYLWQLFIHQSSCCALTNDTLTFGKTCRDNTRTASLDRIDPNQGYVVGNVQWLHKDVNFAKQRMSQQMFIDMCKKVTLTSGPMVKLDIIGVS